LPNKELFSDPALPAVDPRFELELFLPEFFVVPALVGLAPDAPFLADSSGDIFSAM
jgi:hypothetical protein